VRTSDPVLKEITEKNKNAGSLPVREGQDRLWKSEMPKKGKYVCFKVTTYLYCHMESAL
jgi:hypothetical protein